MFASLGGVAVTNQQYVEEFFKNSEEDNERKKECDLCHRKYSKDNGYSNLMNHLKSQHPDYVQIYDVRHPPVVSTQQAKIDNFFGASSKAKQLWYWIRKVVLIPEPFTGTWKEERRRELPKKQQRLPLVQQMMTPTMTHRWLRAERPAES